MPEYVLEVCIDGKIVTREFDAEDETIEAVGEAIMHKEQGGEGVVVTLLVSTVGFEPPVRRDGPETARGGLIGQQPY